MYPTPVDLPCPSPLAAQHSEETAALIREEIAIRGGSIDFSRFMELALYAPGLGYYAAGARKFGHGGDFVTAPEISTLFSRCLARQVHQVLAPLDSGAILELGAGSGTMAADILIELEMLGCLPERYWILEISPDLQQRQRQCIEQRVPHLASRVEWLQRLPGAGFRGVIIGNELLDAMPVGRFRVTGDGVLPLHVRWDGTAFGWCLGPADTELEKTVAAIESSLGRHLPIGYESELNFQLTPWLRTLSTVLAHGVLLLIDYGYPRAEYYHPQRSEGTLQCHFQHRVHSDPLCLPGIQDITASVDFSAVAMGAEASGLALCGYASQSWFLLSSGLEKLMLESDPSDVRSHLEMTRQAKILMLPGEMGERCKAIALGRGYNEPLIGFSLQDQRHHL